MMIDRAREWFSRFLENVRLMHKYSVSRHNHDNNVKIDP